MKLQEITVPAGGQATIDFTAIPTTYKHLLVYLRGRGDQAVPLSVVNIAFNGDTVATHYASNNGGQRCGLIQGATTTAGQFSALSVELPDYTATTTHKAFVGQAQRSTDAAGIEADAGFWTPPADAAITEVTLSLSAGSFAAGTVCALFGVDPQAGTPAQTGAMQKIAEVVVPAGGQAAIPFTAIPQTFRTLKAEVSVRSD
jgi:hypothetical protein